MLAASLISYSVPPLKLTDTGEKALNWMSDFHVRHLPVVEDGKFLGIISEDEILNFLDPSTELNKSQPDLIDKKVYSNQHLYDIMQLLVDANLTVVAVLNEEEEYLGLITLENLIKQLANTASITHPGGVLVLEMNYRDYSLGEIARIVESEKAVILSSFISSPYGTESLELTLKLNKKDLKHVVATLERFGYQIKASFYESDYLDSLKDRYDALMRFLDLDV
ncbi:MAG: CBS domain-containing protein [Saprospiraceae bacterium]|nr:CBS domain-containing protein [Saprospiraceae bacterium]